MSPVGATADAYGSAAALDSFDRVWQVHRLPMLQLARMLVDSREAAEDVVQEAFAGLYRSWDQVENPVGYLRTAVVNRGRSVLRRRRTARAWVPPHMAPAPGVDEDVLIADEHRQVLAALERLPRRQRQVLVLEYWEDLKDHEIATILGVSASTVRATAARGRAALAAALEAGAVR